MKCDKCAGDSDLAFVTPKLPGSKVAIFFSIKILL